MNEYKSKVLPNVKMERKKKEEKAFKEKVVIEFYKRNPEIFLERELGIKLSWLQKKLLHLFFRGKHHGQRRRNLCGIYI